MNRFSEKSKAQLATCHPDLRLIFETVLPLFDCTIIEGHRSIARQKKLFERGLTQIDGITRLSKHNHLPSLAVDVVPYPINWNDRERMTLFAGVVLGVAACLLDMEMIEHQIRWGGDWDRDTEVEDNGFDDLPHFELVPLD